MYLESFQSRSSPTVSADEANIFMYVAGVIILLLSVVGYYQSSLDLEVALSILLAAASGMLAAFGLRQKRTGTPK